MERPGAEKISCVSGLFYLEQELSFPDVMNSSGGCGGVKEGLAALFLAVTEERKRIDGI